jgi:hypothetical protein
MQISKIVTDGSARDEALKRRNNAMPNGRCRMHGGPSTGPKTAEGKARIRASRTKHGRNSQAAIASRRETRSIIRAVRELLNSL